jgi:micrococcal nuclease
MGVIFSSGICFAGEVDFLSVVDGDTVRVSVDGEVELIRVAGINTPEIGGKYTEVECFGKKASEMASDFFKDVERVDYSFVEKDRYGRSVAFVYVDGVDFGAWMVEGGAAKVYNYAGRGFEGLGEYRRLEKSAKEADLGVWDCDNDYLESGGDLRYEDYYRFALEVVEDYLESVEGLNSWEKEDVASNVMVELYDDWGSFDKTRDMKGLVLKIASSKVFEYFRDREVAVSVEVVEESEVLRFGYNAFVERAMWILDGALDNTKVSTAGMFKMRYLGGYTLKAVGEKYELGGHGVYDRLKHFKEGVRCLVYDC